MRVLQVYKVRERGFVAEDLGLRVQGSVQGLSLDIPAGTSCALVGTSGSGKSTVLRLLFRFYEPESGTLSVAGRSITDYTMKSLRAKIGEVGPHIITNFTCNLLELKGSRT